MRGCGPGTRATCSAVLSGVLEAYPLLGTTPGVLGGGAGGGLRAIFWRVTAYFVGFRSSFGVGGEWRASSFSQPVAFLLISRGQCHIAGLLCSFVLEVPSAQQRSQLEQQVRHLLSHATLNALASR